MALLEVRNVFGRVSGEIAPREWKQLQRDIGNRILVDVMQWDLQRQKSMELFERYSHRLSLGTFDVALIASALLTGATEFLSFDEQAKALAVAERLRVYPKLGELGKRMLAKLKG